MGYEKNRAAEEQDEAAAAWDRKAKDQDIRCGLCGEIISYPDREIYEETGRCLEHAQYARSKD